MPEASSPWLSDSVKSALLVAAGIGLALGVQRVIESKTRPDDRHDRRRDRDRDWDRDRDRDWDRDRERDRYDRDYDRDFDRDRDYYDRDRYERRRRGRPSEEELDGDHAPSGSPRSRTPPNGSPLLQRESSTRSVRSTQSTSVRSRADWQDLDQSLLRHVDSHGGASDMSQGDSFNIRDFQHDDLESMLERREKVNMMKATLLKRIPALRNAPQTVRDFLVDNMQYDTLNADETFCVQGDYGDCMFLLAFGRANVMCNGKFVSVVRDGDYFGEAAAMEGCLRVATVQAVTRCDYFSISRDVLLECVVMFPPLKAEMEKQMLKRAAERDYSLEERRKPDVQRAIAERVRNEVAMQAERSSKKVKWRRNRRIGGGAFGDVYSAINTATGEPMAVKIIQIGHLSEKLLVALERESDLMQRLSHENLVKGYGLERDEEHGRVYILMELVPLGSLQTVLKEYGPVAEAAARAYAKELFAGLAYLHDQRVLHRDIKPANCLISAKGTIKLADFGISRMGLSLQTQNISGTPAYMSPDAINGRYSVASDLWAVGCTLLELITGEQPWGHLGLESSTQIIFHIATSPKPYPLPDSISPYLREVLSKLLNLDPDQRGTAKDIMSMEWFSVDEDKLPEPAFGSQMSGDFNSPDRQHSDPDHRGAATANLTSFLVQLKDNDNSTPSSSFAGPSTQDSLHNA